MIKFDGTESADELVKSIVAETGISKNAALIAAAYSLEWSGTYAARHYGDLYTGADLSQIAGDLELESNGGLPV